MCSQEPYEISLIYCIYLKKTEKYSDQLVKHMYGPVQPLGL